MLEIAGGIVLGFFALALVMALFIAVVNLISRFSEDLIVFAGIVLAVVFFMLGCWAAWSGYVWLCGVFGETYVDLFAEPLVVGSIVVGLPLLFLDSLQGFKWTARFFRWAVRVGKPSTWKARWRRYRIVAGHTPPIVLGYAPFLWMAKMRKKSLPLSRVQRYPNDSECTTDDILSAEHP